MSNVFHITSGDIAGNSLARAGLPGDDLGSRDQFEILYRQHTTPGK